jgi:ferredoxin/flavodoxin
VRGAVCYYSGSGNTKLACEYLAARLGIQTDLFDVISEEAIDLAPYDFVGLAASTDFGGPPQIFEQFLADVPPQERKPAFVLNTFGMMSGRTLRDLVEQSAARGFTVIAGYSMRMPESYPPMMALGLAFADQPKPNVMLRFDAFIGELTEALESAREDKAVESRRVRYGLLGSIARRRERTLARQDMGEKFVDAELCIECGMCASRCPYHAIELRPGPVFDMDACRGCWRCYNGCAQHAIYTKKFRGGPFYAGPGERTRNALRP